MILTVHFVPGDFRGGTGEVSMAIARSAKHFGATIMTESPVENVIIKNGRALGVALENGDEYKSDIVIWA